MQNVKVLSYFHLHGIVFIWGFTAVLGALIDLDAIPLVWYRMGLASILVFFFMLWRQKRFLFPVKDMLLFLIAGVIIAVHWLTFFGAIKVSNVSVTLAVMSTGAFFTSLLEPLFYRRKIILYEVIFGLLAILGLYIIFQASAGYYLGILLALISAFLSALFSVLNGKFVQRYEAVSISFYELLFGVLFITVFLGIRGDFSSQFFSISKTDWIYLFILASACTAYAFIASIHVMKWLSPYTVMLTINLEPVYGIILALVILGDSESMSSGFYLGALIILVTVILNGILKTRKKKKLTTHIDS